MEKTLTIDGKEVRFRSSGGVLKRYKAQFQRDLFADISKLGLAMPNEKKVNIESLSDKKLMELMGKIDLDLLADITWVFAKTADQSIHDPLTWLDGFETFPIMEIFPEIQELLTFTMQGSKKK